MNPLLKVVALGLSLGIAQSAAAQLQIYHDEATFLANAGPLSTETFDGYPATPTFFPGPTLQIGGVTYTAIGNLLNSWVVFPYDASWPGHSAPNALGYQTAPGESLTFAPGPVRSIGFWLGTPGDVVGYPLTIREANGTTTSLVVQFPATNTPSPRSQFIGFVAPGGIVEVNVMEGTGSPGSKYNWIFDDVSVGSTVVDTNPPVITKVTASPGVLWPPNHKMVSVVVQASVSDDSGVAAWNITSVQSNEAINGRGDGNASPDWLITGDHTLQLRAERSGNGDSRIYSITVQATDASGNLSEPETVTVTVPKSAGKAR
jgi:hypothetical protein